MEKQFNREEEMMKKLLNDAGIKAPSADFKNRIMGIVEQRNVAISPYKPLIPKFVWFILAGCILSAVIGLYLMSANVSWNWSLDFRVPEFIEIPSIRLSETMQYAIAFIALFFLQIPFMKRFLDRQYQL
ncbi:hypothetical protein E0K83_00355 [Gramella sp. BOM4]|nr:hypothetical protein [Christiangramia bathymodioli]